MKRQLGVVLLLLLSLFLSGCAWSSPASGGGSTPGSSGSTAPSASTSTPVDHRWDNSSYNGVTTDWSKLDSVSEAEPTKYSFSPHYCGDTLVARSDYGLLLPYVGMHVINEMWGENYSFGLVSTSGEIVTSPSYFSINPSGSFLILSKTTVVPIHYGDGEDYDAKIKVYTIAALDGSWVLNGDYRGYNIIDPTHFALYQEDNSVTIIDASGKKTAYFSGKDIGYDFDWGLSYEYGEPSEDTIYLFWSEGIGYLCSFPTYEENRETYPVLRYLIPATGKILDAPQPDRPSTYIEDYSENDEKSELSEAIRQKYDYIYKRSDPYTQKIYYLATSLENDDTTEIRDLLDAEGRVLYSYSPDPDVHDWLWSGPTVANGWFSIIQNDQFCYYDLASKTYPFRFPLNDNAD